MPAAARPRGRGRAAAAAAAARRRVALVARLVEFEGNGSHRVDPLRAGGSPRAVGAAARLRGPIIAPVRRTIPTACLPAVRLGVAIFQHCRRARRPAFSVYSVDGRSKRRVSGSGGGDDDRRRRMATVERPSRRCRPRRGHVGVEHRRRRSSSPAAAATAQRVRGARPPHRPPRLRPRVPRDRRPSTAPRTSSRRRSSSPGGSSPSSPTRAAFARG